MAVAPLSHHFTTDGEFLSPLPLCSSPVPKFEREVWHGGGWDGVEAVGNSRGERWKRVEGFKDRSLEWFTLCGGAGGSRWPGLDRV
jgi:hypothetical protein